MEIILRGVLHQPSLTGRRTSRLIGMRLNKDRTAGREMTSAVDVSKTPINKARTEVGICKYIYSFGESVKFLVELVKRGLEMLV